MKKVLNLTIIVCCLFLVLTTTSCSKFLDIKPQSDLTTDNAYGTAKDFKNALNGAYRTFYGEYYQWDNVLLSDVRSDNAYAGGGGDQPIVQYDMVDIPVSNNRIFQYQWEGPYQGISRSNIILNKIDSVKDPLLGVDNLREQIIGQACFIRAFNYYQLVKTFGGVPIELRTLSTSDPSVTNLPRSTEKEVYDQIVKDLELAVADLPDDYGDATINVEKATRGAANALLAKVWAQRSDRDYSKVIDYCDEVINSPLGYQLVADYAQLFDGDNYTNAEAIFEIAFQGDNYDVSNWAVQLFLAPEDGWQKYCIPSKDLVAAYDNEGDISRKDANIVFWDNLPWADENWNPCYDANVACPFNYKQKHPNGWNSGDRLYLLRLGDIVLLKAEAQNETGDLSGALTTLNQIRFRAGLADATASTKEELRLKILNERRLELAFEAQRWDDLVRLGVATDVMNNLQEYKYTCENNIVSAPIKIDYNVSDYKWLCPIPQQEMDANAKLKQNPGY